MTSRNHSTVFRPSRLLRAAGVATLAAAMIVPGCGKKEEPPPPPPPPPPPVQVPDPVDIQAIRSELGADARVQVARAATTTDRALAEATIRLADAWARGDADALRRMLSRGDRAVLDDLRSTGDWDAEIEKIEQVRIVYLSEHGADIPLELPDPATLMQQMNLPTDMPEGARQMMEQAMAQMMENPEQLAEMARSQLQDPAVRGQLEQMGISMSQIEESLAELEGGGVGARISGPVVTLALQQPDGAFVLAFNGRNSGGNWTFESLHTVDRVRRRASDWDGNPGLAGAAPPEITPDEPGRGTSPQEEPFEEEDYRTPGQKQTPAGPLQIPGSS